MSNGDQVVQIRAVTIADIPNLAGVQLRSALVGFSHIFPESIPKPAQGALEDEWAALIADADKKVLAATIGEVLVGAVVFGPDREEEDKGTDGLLLKLYVAPTYFGRGVGSILHDQATDWFRQQGYRRARLWVLEHNTRARHMYERRGWIHHPWSRSDWPGSGIDEVGYVLDLVPAKAPD